MMRKTTTESWTRGAILGITVLALAGCGPQSPGSEGSANEGDDPTPTPTPTEEPEPETARPWTSLKYLYFEGNNNPNDNGWCVDDAAPWNQNIYVWTGGAVAAVEGADDLIIGSERDVEEGSLAIAECRDADGRCLSDDDEEPDTCMVTFSASGTSPEGNYQKSTALLVIPDAANQFVAGEPIELGTPREDGTTAYILGYSQIDNNGNGEIDIDDEGNVLEPDTRVFTGVTRDSSDPATVTFSDAGIHDGDFVVLEEASDIALEQPEEPDFLTRTTDPIRLRDTAATID